MKDRFKSTCQARISVVLIEDCYGFPFCQRADMTELLNQYSMDGHYTTGWIFE
jgi:hypothetical protein